MVRDANRSALLIRLIVGLALLGWPRVGSAAGTWAVISLPQKSGEVISPTVLAVDATGDLYVAGTAIQKRDDQGNWSVIAAQGLDVGEVNGCWGLAVDGAGRLYVADLGDDGQGGHSRIQQRDAQGRWSVIATEGSALGQVDFYSHSFVALAVDAVGNLYVAVGNPTAFLHFYWQIQQREVHGNWKVVATSDTDPVWSLNALAVDGDGSLYGASWLPGSLSEGQISKRDTQGNWSMLATNGQIFTALAVDGSGNLYGAEGRSGGPIQRRDAQGHWTVVAPYGSSLGQVNLDNQSGLAVDAAGNLYVADTGNHRILKYTP
jgi:hypothetical protein